MIDLRTDTVTLPTQAMRDAMAGAEVGDDVYGEDPTINALEAKAAALLGKEAAVFVASGTQSNFVALLTHCTRGDEYIVGQTAHTYRYEGGGAAVLGGIQPQPLPFQTDGTLDLIEVEEAIKPDDPHFARTKLLCIENTQDGQPIGPDHFGAARRLVDRYDLSLHLDGARLFNATVALGVDPQDITQHCDSVSICLSKGLGAPMGSVLVGDAEFVVRARRWRKVVGGGMRQAGIVAAGGLYALENNIRRLADDHAHAATVAAALEEKFQGHVAQHTNMVFLDMPNAELNPFLEHVRRFDINVRDPRWVVHLGISDDDVDAIVAAVKAY